MELSWKNANGIPVYPSRKTIKDWCDLFGARRKPRHGWFQVPGTAAWLWFPHSEARNWRNRYRNPNVFEEDLGSPAKKLDAAALAERNRTKVEEEIRKTENGEVKFRLVFFNDNRKVGAIPQLRGCYGFLGVFTIDAEQSRKEGRCVYKRIADSFEWTVPSAPHAD